MREVNMTLKKRKKERIKISNISQFKDELKREGYNISELDEEKFKEKVIKIFKVDTSVIDRLYICIKEGDITYKANNIRGFIDYIEKIMLFENEHNNLCKKLSKIKKLNIDRIEYEREIGFQDNVTHIINTIEKTKNDVSSQINEKEKIKIDKLEKELDKECIYTKDIELLKKMIIVKKDVVKEKYNDKTRTKTISIEIPEKINHKYIIPEKGTIEYHQHLSNNIPRIQRLIRNMHKYIESDKKEKTTFKIEQSKTLQDSINIAVAIYDNKEFKAISGSNNVRDYCFAPAIEEAVFKSYKVNKLGELGVGYNRVNDSEKKIFEEIHKQIESKVLKNEGNLILYSKWEPCPSCYFVISQFCQKHPNIKVKVKYSKKYGE
ncbi:hypothetical protein JCM1393_22610 [Clostridium carnis]